VKRREHALMHLAPLAWLALGACGDPVTFQHRVTIRQPPPAVPSSSPSALTVPTSCPVYAPGGGEVDTPEPPFPAGVAIICVVDDTGGTYGVVPGDAPPAQLAVVPGHREIGLYVGFTDPGKGVLSSYDDLIGDSADIKLWAAPIDPAHPMDCCTEANPGARLELRAVAKGPQGVLVSLGTFDGTPTHVGGSVQAARWYLRFYVNGPW
jgi:hypothetical protein